MIKYPRGPLARWALMALAVGLAACAPSATPGDSPSTSSPAAPLPFAAPTVVSRNSPEPGGTPPVPVAPNALVVCMASEPSSLYIYNNLPETARLHVLEAIADGPVDRQGFEIRPVILETLPSPTNGGLRFMSASVTKGEAVVNATGDVVALQRGVRVWATDPETGLPADEPVTYSGSGNVTLIQMQAVFRLRPDLRWSDGQPLSAEDSVFSFEVAGDPATLAGKYANLRTQSYVAEDAVTVVWTGLPGLRVSEPTGFFWPPLPKHAYEGMTPAEMMTAAEVNRLPIGWGPFRMAEWVDGWYIRVTRNPYYFRSDEGLPRLDEVIFLFVRDPQDALARLASGECDLTTHDADWVSRLDDVLAGEAAGQWVVHSVPGPEWEHIELNLSPAQGYAGTARFLRDTRVRQALAHCLDRKTIVQEVWGGHAEVPDTYLPQAHPLWVEGMSLYRWAPALGRALLDEAGWVPGADGIRQRNGARLSFSLVLNASSDEADRRWLTAQRVRDGLRESCGIEAKLELLDGEDMYEAWPGGRVFGRRFDLAQFAWTMTGTDPLCDAYFSTAVAGSADPGGLNASGYANDDFDSACEASRVALDDASRRAAQALAQYAFARDIPALPLYFEPRFSLARPGVIGLRPLPGGGSELWNVEEWAADG